jgi:hypothetical protein
MKKYLVGATILTALLTLPIGWFFGDLLGLPFFLENKTFVSPFIDQIQERKLPLLKYTLENLQNYPFKAGLITVEEITTGNKDFVSYLFSYQTLGKTMTGQLNVPVLPPPEDGYPTVIMLRGFVPEETYQSGDGTKNAAAAFAKNGYITLAPDFFGYGKSDSESEDSWEARFQKPINVIELLKTLEANPQIEIDGSTISLSNCSCDKKIWAHSNGGQIALTTLEVSQLSIKTTLWAPVTAPFPYSILFYSDEHDDGGKEMRKWLSLFEENYDATEFSITQHLDKINGSLQIHQGTTDDAIPISWSDDFVQKIKAENKRREELLKEIETSTQSAVLETPLPPIEINYFKYPNTDHNLQPNWNVAIQRDLKFFENNLEN